MSGLWAILLSAFALTVLSFIAWRIQHAFERREVALDARDAKAEQLATKVDDMGVQLALLVSDSQKNSGKTSRDALDRIEGTAKEVNVKVDSLDRRLSDHLIESKGDSVRLADHIAAHSTPH